MRSAVVLACLVGSVAGCGSDSSDDEATSAGSGSSPTSAPSAPEEDAFDTTATFRWAYASADNTFDPHEAFHGQTMATNLIYDGLIYPNPNDGEDLEPMLATGWELSEDGLTLTLTLREGVTFHDGEPFNAEAVRLNLERAKSEGMATAAMMSIVESVEVVDEFEVALHLSSPGGHVPALLADRPGLMISPAALDNPDLGTNPVGSGPMRFVSATDAVTNLERFDDYWGTPVQFAAAEIHIVPDDAARLNGVRSGQFDATHIRYQQRAEAEAAGLTIESGISNTQIGILLNPDLSEFASPEVRRALFFAIDRAPINEGLFSGGCEPNGQYFLPGTFAHSEALEQEGWGEYDLEQARSLLAEAGLSDGFSFEMAVYNVPIYQRVAEALQAQLAEVGITVTLNLSDPATHRAAWQSGQVEAFLYAYFANTPDPTSFINDFVAEDGAFNPAGFSVPGLADLTVEAQRSTNADERAEPMVALLDAVYESVPIVVPVCDTINSVIMADGVSHVPGMAWGNNSVLRTAGVAG